MASFVLGKAHMLSLLASIPENRAYGCSDALNVVFIVDARPIITVHDCEWCQGRIGKGRPLETGSKECIRTKGCFSTSPFECF